MILKTGNINTTFEKATHIGQIIVKVIWTLTENGWPYKQELFF